MATEARRRAISKYHKSDKCYRVNMVFFTSTDGEVIERLKSVENRTDYIRQLVRRDIEGRQR